MNQSLITAAGLGAVTGLRSMMGVAWTARALAGRRRRRASTLERALAHDAVATALAGLAVGEIVVDKAPGIPARVTPGPLLARAALGALVGAVAGGREDAAAGALVGGSAAVGAAFAGWMFRTGIGPVTRLPDAALAAAEDAVALLGGRAMAERL